MAHITRQVLTPGTTLALVLTLCSLATVDLHAQGGGQHPMQAARRLPDDPIRFPVSGGRVTSEGEAIVARLTGSSPTARIGALEFPDNEVFGAITDVAIDRAGRIFVLDGRLKFVRMFSADGEFIATIGRSGSGPGEFRSPRTIAIDESGNLLVSDVGRKLNIFEPAGKAVRYSRTVTLETEANDMCTMNGSLYVAGAKYGDTTAVHRLDSTFTTVKSFGVVYNSGDALTDYQVAQGSIACFPDVDALVVGTSALIGELRAFRGDCTPMWMAEIVGYRPIDYVINSDGSRQATVPDNGYHRVRTVTADGATHLIVQVGLDTRESRNEHNTFATLTSYRIDVRDGKVTALGVGLPWIAKVGRGVLLTRFEDPYPGVDVHRIGRS